MSTKLPTPAKLRELLHYSRMTGVLTWKPRKGSRYVGWNELWAGKVAGTVMPNGAVVLKLLNRKVQAHRAIWAMMHDRWPDFVVHRNGNHGDNRLSNLRESSRPAIHRTQKLYRTNTSGIRGVAWCKRSAKWVAYIKIGDHQFYVGRFDEKAEAAEARREAERLRDRVGI